MSETLAVRFKNFLVLTAEDKDLRSEGVTSFAKHLVFFSMLGVNKLFHQFDDGSFALIRRHQGTVTLYSASSMSDVPDMLLDVYDGDVKTLAADLEASMFVARPGAIAPNLSAFGEKT